MSSTAVHLPSRDPTQRARGAGRTSARNPDLSPTEELKASLRKLLATLLDRAAGLALDKVGRLARSLDDIAARGGVGLNALLGGARAALEGHNPIWGAITGAVSALSPWAKAALIVALVLALLLLPVTVALLLLVLIVVVVVAAVRAGSTGR